MRSVNNNSNKYVCPNDRQLSLRAKLRSGWCAARSTPLTPAERAAIVEVVQRSERLEEAEARRVGRLVERVECLRRGAQGSIPGHCSLCGDRPRILVPLRKCCFCEGSACSRCVIEHGARREQYLCNICAETREMWKKSGAWFFRGVPRHVLPKCREGRAGEARLDTIEVPGEVPGGASTTPTTASYSRQISATESYISTSYPDSSPLESWGEMDVLKHGVSGLSLNRTDSFNQKTTTGGLNRTYSLRSYRRESKVMNQSGQQQLTSPAPRPLLDNVASVSSSASVSASASGPVSPDSGLGTLEVRLAYDNSTSSLACTVLRARGLPAMDMAGLSDPFCRLEILPTEGPFSNRLRTKTVHKTKNPEFNETLIFFGITESDLSSKTLQIKIFDDDRYGCDLMGSTSTLLRDTTRVNENPQILRLALSSEAEQTEGQARPQILLSLSYNTKRRALVVIVCRCNNLPAMDSNGYSDPFVKLHLDPDPSHKKQKTSIKWRNLNPVYNEEFNFETRPTELTKQNLTLTVWDKDYGKPNDFLGSLIIGSTSKGKRLKHWLDCIRFPDHRHEQWHSLTDTEHL